MPWIIGICAGGLGAVSVGHIIYTQSAYDYSDIPRGDLELYDIPEAGLFEKAEEAVIDFIEDKIDAVGDKISDIHDNHVEKRKQKKEAKIIAKMLNKTNTEEIEHTNETTNEEVQQNNNDDIENNQSNESNL